MLLCLKKHCYYVQNRGLLCPRRVGREQRAVLRLNFLENLNAKLGFVFGMSKYACVTGMLTVVNKGL